MDIKTITCHHVYNYGATLQAFALQHYLESIGHEVSIIDYRLSIHNRYELFTPYPAGRLYKLIKSAPFLKYIITPIRNRRMLKTWKRKKAFDSFDKSFLHITPHTYKTYNEIKTTPPKADIFIAGSDQIWNPDFPNGRDPGYYLNFGDQTIKRISYAASFGIKEISETQGLFVKNMLAHFNAISVREESGLNILKKLGIQATKCIDPVFLLNCSEWINQLKLTDKIEKYILVYDFTHDDKRIQTFTQELAQEKNLKIIAINDFENTPYANKQINNAGPIEFLQYIINAEYIIANSFHATAFSLIFHKNFVTFPLVSQNNRSRMIDLLTEIGLYKRFNPDNISVIDEHIAWSNIDLKLEYEIQNSKQYLHNAISF